MATIIKCKKKYRKNKNIVSTMLTQHLFMQEKFVVQTFTFLCTRLPSFVQDKIRKTFREQSWRKIGMLSISQFTFKDYKYKTYNNFKDYYFKPRHSSTF